MNLFSYLLFYNHRTIEENFTSRNCNLYIKLRPHFVIKRKGSLNVATICILDNSKF